MRYGCMAGTKLGNDPRIGRGGGRGGLDRCRNGKETEKRRFRLRLRVCKLPHERAVPPETVKPARIVKAGRCGSSGQGAWGDKTQRLCRGSLVQPAALRPSQCGRNRLARDDLILHHPARRCME